CPGRTLIRRGGCGPRWSSTCGPWGVPAAVDSASRAMSRPAPTSHPRTSRRTTMPEPEVQKVVVDGRRLRLTSLDKILYPATETTKGEVLNYYAQISAYFLPLLADRPVTRVRYPHGVNDMSFFEKNLPSGAPSWMTHTSFDEMTYPFVPDVATLTYLVNLNSIEFHIPQWRVNADGQPDNPDRLVLDLDPGRPAGLKECA